MTADIACYCRTCGVRFYRPSREQGTLVICPGRVAHQVWVPVVNVRLSQDERKALRLRYGAEGDPVTVERLAELLGIDRLEARKLENEALRKLKEARE